MHAGLFSCLHNPLNSDARYNTWITCACDLFKRVSNGGSRLIVKFKFIVVLRPQRPDGLLGTGSPGRTPRLSHSSRVLVYSLTGSTICTVCTEFDWGKDLEAATNLTGTGDHAVTHSVSGVDHAQSLLNFAFEIECSRLR